MIGCRNCKTLRAELDRAHTEKQKLLEHILALTAPHALAMSREGMPQAVPTAYDAETGYTALVDGREVPIVYRKGAPVVPVSPGVEVPLDAWRQQQNEEYRRVREMLDRMDNGETPRMGDDEATPLAAVAFGGGR